MPRYNSFCFAFLYASDHLIKNLSARLFGGLALYKLANNLQSLFLCKLSQLKELGFNAQNLSLWFIRRFTSIEEELFGLIHITHIEKLSEGNRNEKSLHIARQGEQKDWLQNFCFALSFAQTNHLVRDRALVVPLKKPWRVAQKWHSVSLCDAPSLAVSGESENWRCFLNEVRTLYEQNPQDFE